MHSPALIQLKARFKAQKINQLIAEIKSIESELESEKEPEEIEFDYSIQEEFNCIWADR